MNIPYIKIEQGETTYYLCTMKGSVITNISYVARRGETEEQGAVQRILNKSRISGIKEYLLNGGFFPNNIILNVVKSENIIVNEDSIELISEPRIAQIIDGQHRVEGMKEAIKANHDIGEIEFPILLTLGLTTAQCAQIFVSINTEQKAVPKSLIYDLYGVIDVPNRDYSIDRGTDIADILNKDESSPYQGLIKFPGMRRFRGGIQLSTFVNYLKPLVAQNGEFNKYNIDTLELQAKILINYFSALEYCYDKDWNLTANPFILASGYGAAIDVLISKILPYCFSKKNFSIDIFRTVIVMDKTNLIYQTEVKGLGGEAAREYIRNKLSRTCVVDTPSEYDFEI